MEKKTYVETGCTYFLEKEDQRDVKVRQRNILNFSPKVCKSLDLNIKYLFDKAILVVVLLLGLVNIEESLMSKNTKFSCNSPPLRLFELL